MDLVSVRGGAKVRARGRLPSVWALALVAALPLGGCTSSSVPHALDPHPAADRLTLDRQRLQAEADTAVAIPGRRVCREQPLGLAERETQRGVVVRDAQGQWRVRTEAGAEAPALEAGWTPCR